MTPVSGVDAILEPKRPIVTISDFPAKASTLSVEEIAGLARRVEEVGLDRFAVTDWPYYFDCVAAMTACLARTDRVIVESLVTTPFARHPEATACMFATMHQYSGGRVVLGVGAGVEEPSSVWVPPWGNTRPKPLRAVRELVTMCRTMWDGGVSSQDGVVLRGSGLSLRYAVEGSIPVLIAARGPQMLELAGELADIVHLAPPFLGEEYVSGCIDHVRRGAERAGRRLEDIEIDLTLSAAVLDDAQRARELAKTVSAYGIVWMTGTERYASARMNWEVPAELDVDEELVRRLASWDMWSGEPLPESCSSLMDDEVMRQFAVAGNPEECGARFGAVVRQHPAVTGLRLKLPPLTGPESYATYRAMIEGVATAMGTSGEALERPRSRHGLAAR